MFLFQFVSFPITLVCYELMWSIMQIARGDVVHVYKSKGLTSLSMSEKQRLSRKQEAEPMTTMAF